MYFWKIPWCSLFGVVFFLEIFIFPIRGGGEILLKPQELGSISSQEYFFRNITVTTTATTTESGENEIITTTSVIRPLLQDDPEETATEIPSETSEDTTEEIPILLKSSESDTSNRVSCKGAFFCRYRTLPYTTAKIRLFSNVARVDQKLMCAKTLPVGKQKLEKREQEWYHHFQSIKCKDADELNYVLDGTESWEDGFFEVEGENRDFSIPFRPVIAIYHQCGQLKRKNATYRRFVVKIPQQFVDANGTVPFDIGTINLEVFFPAQKEDIRFVHFNRPLEISGLLFCGGQQRHDITTAIVRLFSSNKQEPESFITEQQPDSTGHFRLSSGRAQLHRPILVVSHQCGVTAYQQKTGIYRQFVILIPYFYYNPGRVGLKVFDIGRLGLDITYPNEQNGPLTDLTS